MTSCYCASGQDFSSARLPDIIEILSQSDAASGWRQLAHAQLQSWRDTIPMLQRSLVESGLPLADLGIVIEYRLPRREKRLDCASISSGSVVIIEFKAGAQTFGEAAIAQAVDYGLDIHNYHENSRGKAIHVLLCSTQAIPRNDQSHRVEKISSLTLLGQDCLSSELRTRLAGTHTRESVQPGVAWVKSRYLPIPGILESVGILFANSIPEDIQSCLASSDQLEMVIQHVTDLVKSAQNTDGHLLLIITGVPGSGKTLVGLKLAHSTLQCRPRPMHCKPGGTGRIRGA